jgi:dimethylglycine dehydrogenase
MVEQGGNLVATEEKAEIRAEHVVTATGNHAQRTARLLGIKTPAVPVEHQYIVTEPDPMLQEWRKNNPEHPVLRDADAKWYVREERGGWILGPYEKGAPARFQYDVPTVSAPICSRSIWSGSRGIHVLHPPDSVIGNRGPEGRFQRPDLLHARRQPAGRPGAGPAQHVAGRGVQLRHHRGGRHRLLPGADDGEGEAEIDMASLDPKRFGNWMTTEYAARKNEECYDHVFILHHPDEEREACRPLRTSPAYDRQKARGAQFGQVNGWDRPNYYGPVDAPATSTMTVAASAAAPGGPMP